MADLLTSPKFGFPATNVALLTNPAPPHPSAGVVLLPADQTTHDGILAAMQKYLVDVPQKGDTVVFYDASHGSLRVNSKGNKLTVLVNGQYVHADSTMVPSDAYKGGYDVRDREMTRIFNAALDKGVHLTVIFDSCHSGGISRGIGPGLSRSALSRLIRATSMKLRIRCPMASRAPVQPSAPTIPRWSFPRRNRIRQPRKCRPEPSRTGRSRPRCSRRCRHYPPIRHPPSFMSE